MKAPSAGKESNPQGKDIKRQTKPEKAKDEEPKEDKKTTERIAQQGGTATDEEEKAWQ